LSTVAIADDLLYIAEFAGIIHCLDLSHGTEVWAHDTEAHVWGCTLVADRKVYAGNGKRHPRGSRDGPRKKVLASIDMKDPIYSSPVAANGVLYVATQSQLYAIEKKD